MLTQEQRQLVENHLDSDPVRVALTTGDRAVAAQIDALQRARVKLPTFYEARCEMPVVSLQQSTSEAVAVSRALTSGELALDLTCGLGVDTYFISRNYKHVITCELDTERAEIARANFKRLEATNVEVKNCAAEDFLSTFSAEADLIFCDPARRDENGKKLADVRRCSPNVVDMFAEMCSKARQVVVKLSPLMDVDETARIFNNAGAQNVDIEVVSQGGECREVVVIAGGGSSGMLRCNMVGRGVYIAEGEEVTGELQPERAAFLYVPDVALVKARCVGRYAQTIEQQCDKWCVGGYLLSLERVVDFAGREFALRGVWEWRPREVKRRLAELGVVNATIHRRDFGVSNAEICKVLGVKEGGGIGSVDLFFTKFFGRSYVCVGCYSLAQEV